MNFYTYGVQCVLHHLSIDRIWKGYYYRDTSMKVVILVLTCNKSIAMLDTHELGVYRAGNLYMVG